MAHANDSAPGDMPPVPEAGLPELGEGVDPDLAALPAPPAGRRLVTMALMALVVAAAVGLLASLRADIAYFFASDAAHDLGEVTGVDAAALTPNTYVTVEGVPMASGTVHYRRLLTDAEYAVFPLAGQRTIYVQLPVEDRASDRASSRRSFSGRLVTFGQLGGRFGSVRAFLDDDLAQPVSSETFLLLADEAPGTYSWAIVLAGLALLIVLLDLLLLLRWFRPLPSSAREVATTTA